MNKVKIGFDNWPETVFGIKSKDKAVKIVLIMKISVLSKKGKNQVEAV